MIYRSSFKPVLVVAIAATALAWRPAPTKAIFHWFRNCGQPSTFASYAPAPCATTQANYVPMTCYRREYVNVPVTTYQPVTACDPCTGYPVTTMRPVVGYATQARLVPYTTYRVVYSAPAVMPAAGAYYSAAPTSACGGCASTVSYPSTYGAAYPSYPTYPSSVSTFAPSNSGAVVSGATNYPGPAEANGATGKTFENSSSEQRDTSRPIDPIPDNELQEEADDASSSNSSNSSKTNFRPNRGGQSPSEPRLIDPESRTTRLPGRAWSYSPVSWPEKQVTFEAGVDETTRMDASSGGDHASRLRKAPAPRRPALRRQLDTSGWKPSSR